MECIWVSDQTGACRVTLEDSFCIEVKANRNTLSAVLVSQMHSRIRAKVLPLQNVDFMAPARRIPDIKKKQNQEKCFIHK